MYLYTCTSVCTATPTGTVYSSDAGTTGTFPDICDNVGVPDGNGSAHTSVTSSATLQLHTCTCESLHEY